MAVRRPPYLFRVTAKNYKSLREVDVRLGALNVLVGPNGAGKSTLLDVLAFLGDSARSDLASAVAARGGWERLCFRGKNRGPISVGVEAAVTRNSSRTAPDEYTLTFQGATRRLGGQTQHYLRREEAFAFKRTSGPGRRITLRGNDLQVVSGDETERAEQLTEGSLALATLPKLGPREGGVEVAAVADLFLTFRVFDVDVPAVRRPAATGDGDGNLADDAANLGPFLSRLAQREPRVFDDLVADAQHFIPGLQSVQFRAVTGAAQGVVVQLEERGLDGLTDLSEASFGSIRALALLALLHDPSPSRITCVEEIDHGLHPYVLDRLVDLLRQASERTQLIVATHSPALVNRLRSNELVVVERADDGSARVPAIEPEVVRRMEAELDGELALGELWFTGALGGVPGT